MVDFLIACLTVVSLCRMLNAASRRLQRGRGGAGLLARAASRMERRSVRGKSLSAVLRLQKLALKDSTFQASKYASPCIFQVRLLCQQPHYQYILPLVIVWQDVTCHSSILY
jgi:hypothetical protein